MNNYRNIATSFWTDSKVDDNFTPEDKYFFFYLLTNPHTNICGCYEISTKQMERETGYNVDTCMRLLERLERVHNVIRYCSETKEVLVLNWGKYNWSKSDKLIKAVISVAEHIKNSKFRQYINNIISNSNTVSVTEADTVTVTDVSIPYGYGIDTLSETNEKEAKRKRFVAPTLEELRAYIQEKGYTFDAERFLNYYESNGWRVGKNPMKSWKSACANWQARQSEYGKSETPKKPESKPSYDADEVEQHWAQQYRE